MNSKEKRNQLNRYFYATRLKKPGITLAVALFFLYAINSQELPGLSKLALAVSLISLGVIIYRLVRYNTAPDDATIDSWLKEDIDKLIEKSYQKLGIEQVKDMPGPLVIISPVYWFVRGIGIKDLRLRKGKDKVLRFSVYQVTIFHLDEHVLGSYICYYNFLRGATPYEVTHEYHYKDVVSVSTEEVSSNYHLPDGQKLVQAQEFRLSVASGERIRIIITPYQIANNENAKLPPTGAEQAVNVIRTMLRTKKV